LFFLISQHTHPNAPCATQNSRIPVHQELVTLQDQEIFSVLLFSSLGKIETSGYQRVPIDDHYFIMGNGMFRIDVNRGSGMRHEIRGGIFLRFLALVENYFNMNATLTDIGQALGDRGTDETEYA
jgi:hypothetical protein